MHPLMKAYVNHEHDTQMRFRDSTLSRKPGSTPEQREALRQRIAERKANGTLNKVPFVLEAVSAPYSTTNGQWAVELTASDGITRRVSQLRFTAKTEAIGFGQDMQEHIGEEWQGVAR